jgi:hypothetical protein
MLLFIFLTLLRQLTSIFIPKFYSYLIMLLIIILFALEIPNDMIVNPGYF